MSLSKQAGSHATDGDYSQKRPKHDLRGLVLREADGRYPGRRAWRAVSTWVCRGHIAPHVAVERLGYISATVEVGCCVDQTVCVGGPDEGVGVDGVFLGRRGVLGRKGPAGLDCRNGMPGYRCVLMAGCRRRVGYGREAHWSDWLDT